MADQCSGASCSHQYFCCGGALNKDIFLCQVWGKRCVTSHCSSIHTACSFFLFLASLLFLPMLGEQHKYILSHGWSTSVPPCVVHKHRENGGEWVLCELALWKGTAAKDGCKLRRGPSPSWGWWPCDRGFQACCLKCWQSGKHAIDATKRER